MACRCVATALGAPAGSIGKSGAQSQGMRRVETVQYRVRGWSSDALTCTVCEMSRTVGREPHSSTLLLWRCVGNAACDPGRDACAHRRSRFVQYRLSLLCCVRCACLVLGSRVDLQLLVKLPNFFDFLYVYLCTAVARRFPAVRPTGPSPTSRSPSSLRHESVPCVPTHDSICPFPRSGTRACIPRCYRRRRQRRRRASRARPRRGCSPSRIG